VVLGIGSRAGRPAFGLPRFAVALVHRNAALLATVTLTIHVVTLFFDPYAQLKLVDLVVPFAGTYRPLWLGLGTLAFDLFIGLMVTGLLRNRIGPRVFRVVHWLAYATWPLAFFHSLGTGTDSGTVWLRTTAVICAAMVVTAVAWRCAPGFDRPGDRRPRRVTAAPATRLEAIR
jgi:sulfoxide reductase heme-binding subunit YedZ